MSIAWATVQTGLFDVIAAAVAGLSPVPVIAWQFQAGQPAAMPPKPCVLLNITDADRPRGTLAADDETQQTTTAGTQHRGSHRAHTLTCNAYSDSTIGALSSRAIIGAIDRYCQSDAARAIGIPAGFKIFPSGAPAKDLSALLTTRAESRTMQEFTFGTLDTTTEVIGWIETVPLTGLKVAPAQT